MFPIAIWTVIELNIGVVCACLPAARLFVTMTAQNVARSAGWSRFSSETSPNPSHYNASSPPSFVKRRPRERAHEVEEDDEEDDGGAPLVFLPPPPPTTTTTMKSPRAASPGESHIYLAAWK